MVKVAETALDFRHESKDDILYKRLVRLDDRTVYERERTNLNPDNPNSVCQAS